MQNTILLEIDNIYIGGQYNAASFKKSIFQKYIRISKGGVLELLYAK
jgi:hypothetical protein